MRYKLLGKSGLRVSELCLGAMTFGEEWGWGASEKESRKIFDAFAEAGGNFIDTADLYTNGTSERCLGKFIAADRERFVLGTKYNSNNPGNDPNAAGNHRKKMVQSLEGSLKRLKVDYIDLYWLHVWDFTTPIEEVMRAFDDMVRAGKVLYIGISNVPAWIVSRANMLAELRSWTEFIALQLEYSLVERTAERELLQMARALDIGVLAWSPLANGLLTGKYTSNVNGSKNNRLEKIKEIQHLEISERNLSIAWEVDKVAQETGRSSAQVALNWVRQQQGVIPIIGARTFSQIKDNLACLDFTLSSEHLQRLNDVSRISLGYPHDFLNNPWMNSLVYGGMFDKIDNHRA